LTCPKRILNIKTVMNDILNRVLNDLNDDNSLNIDNVDLDALQKAVRDEGVRNNTKYSDIKEAVIDLFECVGYNQFGIVDNN
jgi:hypothetical protein